MNEQDIDIVECVDCGSELAIPYTTDKGSVCETCFDEYVRTSPQASPAPTTMSIGKTCNNCEHWNMTLNQCHRFPPMISYAGDDDGEALGYSAFPTAYSTDWCGEHSAIGETVGRFEATD